MVFIGFRVDQKNEIIDIQEQKIQDLNREIGEYQATKDFYWDFENLLEEFYDVKVKEAVLEERVHWLKYLDELRDDYVTQEYYELYVNQLKDDMELLVEVIVDYYEDTDQNMTLETYIAQNYPALYERILGY
jgi:hypothetical protein